VTSLSYLGVTGANDDSLIVGFVLQASPPASASVRCQLRTGMSGVLGILEASQSRQVAS
jgi:hypothetical protein